jgi:hypothetical protein
VRQHKSITIEPSSLGKAGRWALPAALVATALGLSACSSGHSVTGSANGQNFAASTGQLPSGFPSGVPTPSNSRVLGGGGSANNWDVAFAVTGSVSGATTAYQSKLTSAGYTVSNAQSATAASAAGAQFTATSSKWSVQVAGGSSPAAVSGGSLKNGEFPLNVTVTPATSP